jgi:hypothetical protein
MARTTIRTLAALGCSTLLAIAGSLLTASVALAAEDAANSCPALTQAKYPFIECASNEYGGVTLSIPGQPAPMACNLRLANGDCAASTELWRLDIPLIGPYPTT